KRWHTSGSEVYEGDEALALDLPPAGATGGARREGRAPGNAQPRDRRARARQGAQAKARRAKDDPPPRHAIARLYEARRGPRARPHDDPQRPFPPTPRGGHDR